VYEVAICVLEFHQLEANTSFADLPNCNKHLPDGNSPVTINIFGNAQWLGLPATFLNKTSRHQTHFFYQMAAADPHRSRCIPEGEGGQVEPVALFCDQIYHANFNSQI